MYSESKPPVNSVTNTSQAELSDHEPIKTLARDSSSSSLEISQELASIKKEVSNIKDQVWNQVREGLTPSEECSGQNSLTDAQLDLPYSDDRANLNNRETVNGNNERHMSFSSGYRNVVEIQAAIYNQRRSDPSIFPGELEKNQLLEIVLSNETSRRGSTAVAYNEKEMLFNGFVVSNMTNFENRTYTAISVPNSIKSKRNRKNRRDNVLARFQQLEREEMERSNGLESENGLVYTVVPDLNEQGSSNKAKYKEMMSVKDSVGDDLNQANNRLLEEDNVDGRDDGNPFFKKPLSVIFSTNESIQSTPTHSVKRKNTTEGQEEGAGAALQLPGRQTYESIREEPSEDKMSMGSGTHRSDDRRSIVEMARSLVGGDLVTTLGSEENFNGLLYFIRLQNKSNKDLEDKLNRLGELHNKQIEKYEKALQMLNEKVEKFAKGNELLVKTLKTCEKEIDHLALNNQTLTKNFMMYEEDSVRKKAREKQLLEANMAKQKENDKLKEELQRKETELDETRKKLLMSISKMENARHYAKSCEDCITAIDQTLRKTFFDKNNPKMTMNAINKVFASISYETSKFVERLHINRWASVGAANSGSKSPVPKESVRFYTEEDSVDMPDKANTSMHKERPKTPEVKPLATPEKKSRESVRTLSESRLTGSDKKSPLQRLVNTSSSSKQRSLSNISKLPLDSVRRSGDKDIPAENQEPKPKKNTSSKSPVREGNSSPPRAKTPEKPKLSSNQKQINNELDKLKDSLRKKVIKTLNSTPTKK